MHIPLPSFSWANGAEVWNCMLEQDATYCKLRSERILERHPSLVESYRTILLDWLSEVSHECKFHRETYHLAVDFIDRYLAATTNIGKYQLQLIGTTCLFLAAKYEEIRPPTVIELAELTDGACKPEEIVDNEVVVLSALNWDIRPTTPNSWLNIYMQILLNLDQVDESSSEASSAPTAAAAAAASSSSTRKTIAEADTSSMDQFSSNEENSRSSTISTRSSGSRSSSRQRTLKKRKTFSDNRISSTTTSSMFLDENSSGSTRSGGRTRGNNSSTNAANDNDDSEFKLASTKHDSFILPSNNGFLRYNHKRIASVIDLALLHIESLRYSNSVLAAAAIYHFTTEQTTRQCTGFEYEQLAECIHWLEPFVETIREIQEPVFIASCKGDPHPTQKHTHIANGKLLDEVLLKLEARRERQRQSAALKRKAAAAYGDDESASNLAPAAAAAAAKAPTGKTNDSNGKNLACGLAGLDAISFTACDWRWRRRLHHNNSEGRRAAV